MWYKVTEQLPPLNHGVIVRTDYGKYDICHLSIEDGNRLEWTNQMRPQHTNGGVVEWCEIPSNDDDLPF